MSKKRIAIGLIIAVIFQTAILVQMVWTQITLLSSPTEIVLETTPIDPRDLFRGDYVILNYVISSLDQNTVSFGSDLTPGGNAFVIMKAGAPYATPLRITSTLPDSLNAGEAVIRGEVTWIRDPECIGCTSIAISYSINSYFVPEGTGTQIEEYRDERALGVIVSLNNEGDAAIKGLMMDGIKVYDTPLF